MAKTAGGVRTYRKGSSTYRKRQEEVSAMRESGRYSSVDMGKGGGWLAIEKSTARHKPEELEAARILSNKGYKVTLKDEGGQVRTPDGYLFSASFEQRTPTKDGANTIRNALYHARNKGADVAVIYSRDHAFTRGSVENGIKLYEQSHDYKFKRIIVVADNGNVHRYRHNK